MLYALASPVPTVEPSLILTGLMLLLLAIIGAVLSNLWFTGALIDDIKSKRGFERALRKVKSVFWQMLLLSSVIMMLFFIISTLFRQLALFLFLVVDILFFFALPAVVIKKDSFDKALARSYGIVKKSFLEFLAFWLLRGFLMLVILFVLFFFLALTLSPIALRAVPDLASRVEALEMREFSSTQVSDTVATRIAIALLGNYPVVFSALAVLSFFLAIHHCFNYLSKTYYFLELTKKRRKRR